jgi:AraC-like DNA-binding protein
MASPSNAATGKPLAWCQDPTPLARLFPALRWETAGVDPAVLQTAIRTELENRHSPLSLVAVPCAALPELARQGWIRPLVTWFTKGDVAQYAPQAVALATVDGRLYGIPDDITPFGLCVRRDILERLGLPLPRTWDAVEEFAGRLAAVKGEAKRITIIQGVPGWGGSRTRMGFLLSLLGCNGVSLANDMTQLLRDPGLVSSAYDWLQRLGRLTGMHPVEMLTRPRDEPRAPIAWRKIAAGFGWLSVFAELPVRTLHRFIFLPFPRGPGLPPGAVPQVPMKGACWCLPWSKVPPEPAIGVLRAMHTPYVRHALSKAHRFPFYPVRACWDDPAVRRRYPLYRYAADLVEEGDPVSATDMQGCYHRLDVTFRNALIENLDGAGWVEDLTNVQDAPLRAGEAPPARMLLAGVESRLGRLRGLNAMAREMGLRPERLRRLFRRETGEDAAAYVRKRRMDLARELLQEGRLTVKQVAQRVGYGSAAAFCRAYGRYRGHPPHCERGPRGR